MPLKYPARRRASVVCLLALLLLHGVATATHWRGRGPHFEAQVQQRDGVLQVQLRDSSGQPLSASLEARTPHRAWSLQQIAPGHYQATVASADLQHLQLIASTAAWREQSQLQAIPDDADHTHQLLIALVVVFGVLLSPLMALRAIKYFKAPGAGEK